MPASRPAWGTLWLDAPPASRTPPAAVVAIVVAAGLALRLLVALRGYNFDIDSYRIVADIWHHSGNVYAETTRYNYAPIWFHTLGALDSVPRLTPETVLDLRYKVTVLLSLVDLAIAALLLSCFDWRAALLFWLNPVSIIITGYHSQFDNCAVLLALISAKMLKDNIGQPLVRQVPGLVLLGLSIATKHVFIFFPFWLAFAQTTWFRKIVFVAIPLVIFLAGFLPYLGNGGANGIIEHVFLYKSFNNAPFWLGVAPKALVMKIPFMLLFVGTIVFLGLVWRGVDPLESALRYSVALVVFSSAATNQYLAIPLAAIAVHPNPMYAAYVFCCTVFLFLSPDGLHWPVGVNMGAQGYPQLILLLFLGLILHVVPKAYSDRAWRAAKAVPAWLIGEIKEQLRPTGAPVAQSATAQATQEKVVQTQ